MAFSVEGESGEGVEDEEVGGNRVKKAGGCSSYFVNSDFVSGK